MCSNRFSGDASDKAVKLLEIGGLTSVVRLRDTPGSSGEATVEAAVEMPMDI